MSEYQSNQVKCLVVEDYEICSTLIEDILVSIGLDVVVAKDGSEAMELFQSEDFDIIFMDIQLSGESGIEVAKRMRALKRSQPVIIACTANTAITNKEQCLKSGMNDFLSKPVSIDAFERALKQFNLLPQV